MFKLYWSVKSRCKDKTEAVNLTSYLYKLLLDRNCHGLKNIVLVINHKNNKAVLKEIFLQIRYRSKFLTICKFLSDKSLILKSILDERKMKPRKKVKNSGVTLITKETTKLNKLRESMQSNDTVGFYKLSMDSQTKKSLL